MDRDRLLDFLSELDSALWLDLLSEAFDVMDAEQQEEVFGWFYANIEASDLDDGEDPAEEDEEDVEVLDGAELLRAIEGFVVEGFARLAPKPSGRRRRRMSMSDSNTWFTRLSTFLNDAARLTEAGEHVHAVACFSYLEELLEALEGGQLAIIDRGLGLERIGVNLVEISGAYVRSLAETCDAAEFAEMVRPLIERDAVLRIRGLEKHVAQLATAEKKAAL